MKRTSMLRSLIQGNDIVVAPGAADALVAKIIERTGFKALYLTGAGVSYTTLGLSDVGLINMKEMVVKAEQICSAVAIPVIADGDNGYGNALNVRRTIHEYERAGVAAIQLEDQVFPKKCGHLAGKQLIPKNEMVNKIKAALDARNDDDFLIIARTDAKAVDGLDAALDRAIAYQNAGADIIFVEAPESIEEMRLINQKIDSPTMANMVEGGRTPLLSTDELKSLGYKLVIFPNAALRVAAKALLELMAHIKNEGTTKNYLQNMLLFEEFNNLIGLKELQEIDKKYSL